MKAFTFVALVVAAVSLDSVAAGKVGVQVSHHNTHGHANANAGQVARLTNKSRLSERRASGKCRPRKSKVTSSVVATSTSASSTSTSSTKTSSSTKSSSTPAKTSSAEKHIETTNFNDADKNKGKTNNAVNVPTNGLISVSSDQCGQPKACNDVSNTCGPNGNIEWLTCGVRGGGWNPPDVKVSDLKAVDLNEALKDGNSPFHACSGDIIGKFYQYAGQVGVPPIMLASIAMQESSCNPATVGGAGEQGLMQLTKDKCGDAPGGNCKDLDYNISTGAKFLKSTIDGNDGNVLKSIGAYNGWFPGMTVGKATAIAGSCCRCQQNLDYLQQFFNGWMQNVNAYAHNIGLFRNLDACPIG